jgi:ribosomal protein S18 acetylase RimI-like enzyme
MERAVAFCRDFAVRCATRTRDVPSGVAVYHERLRAVWDLNLLWLDAVPASTSAEELAAEAEALQRSFKHRQVIVADEAAGARLSGGLAALGWSVDPVLFMSAGGTPDRPAAAHTVVEVDEPGQRAFREEWLHAWRDDYAPGVVEQLLEQKRVIAAAVDTRFFLAVVDGRPVSVCELYTGDGVAQIEDVGTLQAYRNLGLARAVVLHALESARAAGCDLVFLEADADDWPKELYRRLGFRAIGLIYVFVRKPAA